jgi:tyrosyl-tRNA synthetase
MDVDEELKLIERGTAEIFTPEELRRRLQSAREKKMPLIVKFGADPTVPDIHLGHTVVLLKLKEFQNLGHRVCFIIGDFTARIGDPSGRTQTRKALSQKEVLENAKTYQRQVFKILDTKKTRVLYNSRWLAKMDFSEILELASKYTVARMLERDDFTLRYKSQKPITILEFLYPLIQGFDSIILKADVELGGTDQKFNMLVGRALQREYGQEPQAVITMPLLEGTDGVRKMSKSFNNYIGINEPPKEIFGKVMSISDELMIRYLELLGDVSREELVHIKEGLRDGTMHPKAVKADIARRIVKLYHGEAAAKRASLEFDQIFKGRMLPERISEVAIRKHELTEGKIWICRLLVLAGMAESNSQSRRLIEAGGVRIDGRKIIDPQTELRIKEGTLIQVGRRRFCKFSLR